MTLKLNSQKYYYGIEQKKKKTSGRCAEKILKLENISSKDRVKIED